MKVSKEFKVGLLVVLGLLLLFVGVNYLKGGSLFGEDRVYYASFTNSSGLLVSNEVQVNGLKVGQVVEVGLHPKNPNIILVKFSIENKELQIPHGSNVELISSDILGTKALQLNLNTTPAANLVYYQSGDTLTSSIQPTLEDQISKELLPLKNKTEQLIGSVEAIIVSINAFWDTSAAYTIDESLYEVRDAIGTFGDLANNMSILISKETDRVDRILTDVNSISTNLVSKKDQINGTIDNITAITDTIKNSGLKSVINETTNTLAELNLVLQKINDGQGSLGLLMKTDSLHNELVRTNQSVQSLLDDMEANPNKYVHFSVFGRKPN